MLFCSAKIQPYIGLVWFPRNCDKQNWLFPKIYFVTTFTFNHFISSSPIIICSVLLFLFVFFCFFFWPCRFYFTFINFWLMENSGSSSMLRSRRLRSFLNASSGPTAKGALIWALIMLVLLPWPYERIRQGNVYGHVTGRLMVSSLFIVWFMLIFSNAGRNFFGLRYK